MSLLTVGDGVSVLLTAVDTVLKLRGIAVLVSLMVAGVVLKFREIDVLVSLLVAGVVLKFPADTGSRTHSNVKTMRAEATTRPSYMASR